MRKRGGDKDMKNLYVISITAQSGGGKTTIVTALKERLVNTAVIYIENNLQ